MRTNSSAKIKHFKFFKNTNNKIEYSSMCIIECEKTGKHISDVCV